MSTKRTETNIVVQCGIIMPISASDGYPAEHWVEVKNILVEACASIEAPRFAARLVSESEATAVIHKQIIHSVYSTDIVICDLSSRNANVMFELGLRLAFDKAVVLIKDEETPYSFDTGSIEHLAYPKNLHYSQVLAFKEKLIEKLKQTYQASRSPEYSSFLRNFGAFKTVSLNTANVTTENYILESLYDLKKDIRRLRNTLGGPARLVILCRDRPGLLKEFAAIIMTIETNIKTVETRPLENDRVQVELLIEFERRADIGYIVEKLRLLPDVFEIEVR